MTEVDIYRLDGFLSPDMLARVQEGVIAATGEIAPVYGQAPSPVVNQRVRSAERLAMPDALRRAVAGRLEDLTRTIEQRFGTEPLIAEPPQFLRYQTGDFFVAHQDGNTPVVRDSSRFRRVSVVIFVNSPDQYGEGSLVMHHPYPDVYGRQRVEAVAGSLVAFRSETTHEVTPVTHGVRYTIASWYRALNESDQR